MTEAMEFPKTLDEFMEQYKIVDTEQVYTNGTELVPIFRIKQWEDAHKPRKGKWIEDGYFDFLLVCSHCGNLGYAEWKCCPHCGCEMTKGETQ